MRYASMNNGFIYVISDIGSNECNTCLIEDECYNIPYSCLNVLRRVTGFSSKTGIYSSNLHVISKIKVTKSLFIFSKIKYEL